MANKNADNHEWDCAMCGEAADLRGHRPCAKTGYNELRVTRCDEHGNNKWTGPLRDRAKQADVPAWVRERGSYRDADGRLIDLSGKVVDMPKRIVRQIPRETEGARRAREAQDAWAQGRGLTRPARGLSSGKPADWDWDNWESPKAKPKPKPIEKPVVVEQIDDELAALIKSTENEAAARIKADGDNDAE